MTCISNSLGNWSSRRPVRSQPPLGVLQGGHHRCSSPTHGGTCTNLRSDLVGGWPTPLKNMKVSWDESQLGFPIYGKIKNDPNQQPDTVLNIFNHFHTYSLKFGWISSFWPNVSIKTYQQKNCNKSLTFSNHPALLLASFFCLGSPRSTPGRAHAPVSGSPALEAPRARRLRETATGTQRLKEPSRGKSRNHGWNSLLMGFHGRILGVIENYNID